MALTRFTSVLALGAFALAACTATDIDTGDDRQRTKEGAAIGALAGGVIGALTGDDGGERRRGALAGAVIGAGIGALVGYDLDKQAAELRQDFSNGRIQIVNNGDELVVIMPEDILFDVDSAFVKPGLRSDLGVLAGSLQRYPNSTVQVVGHTDNTGAAEYNLDLSARRADAVSSVLITNGVDALRIQSIGAGEDQPVATNLTPEGRAQNRRVEITIRPNEA